MRKEKLSTEKFDSIIYIIGPNQSESAHQISTINGIVLFEITHQILILNKISYILRLIHQTQTHSSQSYRSVSIIYQNNNNNNKNVFDCTNIEIKKNCKLL